MAAEKQASISADDLGNRPLSQVSAGDFLNALNSSGVSLHHLTVWPEKKKYELWVEEDFGKIRFKDIVGTVREKKKVEIEKPNPVENIVDTKPPGREFDLIDPRRMLILEATLERLVNEVANLRTALGR